MSNKDISSYIRTSGTSYFLASLLFPKNLKSDVFTLYAYVRIADDIVDQPGTDPQHARSLLQELISATMKTYQGGSYEHGHKQIIEAMVNIMQSYRIPRERLDAFHQAMLSDTQKVRYETYDELKAYMYGSAEVIGLMMCKLIGCNTNHEKEVFRTAKLLGEAMQYTNFLRDIKQDYLDFDRIYIPETSLDAYGLSHDDIISFCRGTQIQGSRREFVENEIARVREMYHDAYTGIKYLDKQGRTAVYAAGKIYEKILDQIERYEYDMFTHDVHTTKRQKLITLLHSLISHE